MKRYVVTQYPPSWYFEQHSYEIDRWIIEQFKLFGIKETGSGLGFGLREVNGLAPDEETAKAFRDYISLFYRMKVLLFKYFEDNDTENS